MQSKTPLLTLARPLCTQSSAVNVLNVLARFPQLCAKCFHSYMLNVTFWRVGRDLYYLTFVKQAIIWHDEITENRMACIKFYILKKK